jgi:predicted RNase H-like nuclease
MNEKIVVGLDGCPAGWIASFGVPTVPKGFRTKLFNSFQEVLDHFEGNLGVMAVDMPIGLLDAAKPGGRECEVQARTILRPCASRVFSSPVYAAIARESFALASKINKNSSEHNQGISRQCFGLFPKLRQVHHCMTVERQRYIVETHPELGFAAMNGGEVVKESKRSNVGRELRLTLLGRNGFQDVHSEFERYRKVDVANDDILDAYSCAWVAIRYSRGVARRIPVEAQVDSRGLRMEMWQ